MAFLPAALPLIGAAGGLAQGIGGLLAGKKNKKNAFAQAKEESLTANADELAVRRNARKAIGAQLAAQWGNGLEGGTGTALDALRESELNAAADAAEIRRQGVARATSLRASGKQAQRQGYFDLAGGMLGAADAFGGMKHDWATAGRGTTVPGPG